MTKLSNHNKTRTNKCFLSAVHDRTPRLYRKYLTLEKIETNLNYDYLTKIGSSSELPELICLAISAIPRRIFLLLNRYVRKKNEPKFLKTSLIFFNFNQFNNCPFSLPNYFITLFSVSHRKTAK